MIRNLRTLGLALVAVLSIGAAGASASYASPELHSETGHTILTGQQIVGNELALDVGVMQCGIVQFQGTIASSTTTTIPLTPKFENCEIGEVEVLFTHNGCHFLFHIGPEEHFTGNVDFVCPDEPMEIDGPGCTITIPPQAGLTGETFTNEGEGQTRSVIFDLKIDEIHYVEHGMFCENETETTNNGTYKGKITITGENTAQEHRGIWIE